MHRPEPALPFLAPERFRWLVETVPSHAIVICDTGGRITDWNTAAETITGYDADDAVGRPLAWLDAQVEPGDDRTTAMPARTFAEWRRRSDGRRYWCEGTRFPLTDGAGRVHGSTECFRDASRAKAIELGLRAAEERFAATLRSAPVLVTNQDRELRYTWAPMGIPGREAAAQEELLGRTDEALVPGEASARLGAGKRAVLADGERVRLELALGSGPETRHYDITIEPMHDLGGAVCGVACVAFDVSGHKRIEDDLRRSRGRLAEAEHLARMGSWEWDVATNHVTWSDGLFDVYGIDPAQFEPRYARSSERVHPDDRERVDAAVQRALETGEEIDLEYRIVRPDGRVRRIHGRAEVIFDTAGTPIRLAGTAQDVTEIRAAEAALTETAAELARRAAALHDVTRHGASPPAGIERLITPRQLEILRLIADGYINAEIAGRLYVTEGTVKWHVRQILRSLGVANRAQAVARLLAANRT